MKIEIVVLGVDIARYVAAGLAGFLVGFLGSRVQRWWDREHPP